MIYFAELVERLKTWSDAKHTCTQCGMLEPACDCRSGHEEGQNWTPTEESQFIDEAIVAIEALLGFAERACPKCDGCGKLLLEGSIIESDGLHGKQCRIVCEKCKDPSFVPEKPASLSTKSIQGWNLTEDDIEFITNLSVRAAIAKSSQPFTVPVEQ
jgi:hypothetical protein